MDEEKKKDDDYLKYLKDPSGMSFEEFQAGPGKIVDALKRVLSRALPQIDLVRSQIVRYMRMLGMDVPGEKEAAKENDNGQA